MIDIDKFVASVMGCLCKPHREEAYLCRHWINKALDAQGLRFKDGKIVEVEGGEETFDDEKIRKRLLTDFSVLGREEWGGLKVKDICAWLEKQGKQKPIKEYDACEFCEDRYGCVSPCSMKLIEEEKPNNKVEQKPILDFKARNWYVSKVDGKIHDLTYNPTDKVEPKFKVGDWIVNNTSKDVFLIKSINSGYCTLENIKGNIISPCLPPCESESHIWNIQDAKDGDVLDFDCGIGIFKNLSTSGYNAHCYCYYDRNGKLETNACCLYDIYEAKPATKEQRALLFKEIRKSGYRWDADKKELEKIVIDEGKDEMDYCFTKMMFGEQGGLKKN